MAKSPHLCLLLLLASALTATRQVMEVRQYPAALRVTRGETATLRCHFKVGSLKYGVQWFRMKPDKKLIQSSFRQSVVKKNQTSSLVITQVALEDSGWYYCELNVLQRDPERGNGTELIVLAPPRAPSLYLQIPADLRTNRWALLCLTGGFHPDELTLVWTYQSETDNINHLSVTNCTLPAVRPQGNPADGAPLSLDWLGNNTPSHEPKCFRLIDSHSQEVYLLSVFFLPLRRSLKTGITFTCGVQDHPAMTTALTASFTWDASPNEVMATLNILKLCLISALTLVFLLETVKHLCVKGK